MEKMALESESVIKIPAGRSDIDWKTKSLLSSHSPGLHTAIRTEVSGDVLLAVACIERWWLRVRDRKVFRILKETVCAAESSLTHEVLRKLCPLEAQLLKDPAIKARIKFRFGGPQFPPLILFKIFTSTNSSGQGGVCYISGKRMIKPATKAAEGARQQMGNRMLYNQLLQDACHHQPGATDELDVTTMKEYMQHVGCLDEMPANLGGRDNTWRRLTTLQALPRHSTLSGLVGLLEQQKTSITALSVVKGAHSQHPLELKTKSSLSSRKTISAAGSSVQNMGRRSRQAHERVDKMRKLYTGESVRGEEAGKIETEDEWEAGADDLYQWTQELSFDDIT